MKVNGRDVGKPAVCGACGYLDHQRCAAYYFDSPCSCNDHGHLPEPSVVASVAAYSHSTPEAVEAAWGELS